MNIKSKFQKAVLGVVAATLLAVVPQTHAALVVTDSDLLDSNTIAMSFDNNVDLVTTVESYGESTVEANYITGFDAITASDGDYFDKIAFTDGTTSVYAFQFNVTNASGLGWAAYRFEFWHVDAVTGAFTSQIADAALFGAPGLFAPAGTVTTEVSPAAVMFTFNSPFTTGTMSGRFDVDLNILPVNANDEFGIRQIALLTAVEDSTPVPEPMSTLLFGLGLAGLLARHRKS